MTVQECYQQIQGNYENVLKRLKTDERIVKFLELFLSDTTYEKLSEAVNAKNDQEIFKCVHDLKGMALNLGLTALQKAAQNLCDAVRTVNHQLILIRYIRKLPKNIRKL